MLFWEPVAAPVFSEYALDGGVASHEVGDRGVTTESMVVALPGADVLEEIVPSATAASVTGLGEATLARAVAAPVLFVEADDDAGNASRP